MQISTKILEKKQQLQYIIIMAEIRETICSWLMRPMQDLQAQLQKSKLGIWSGLDGIMLRFLLLCFLFLLIVVRRQVPAFSAMFDMKASQAFLNHSLNHYFDTPLYNNISKRCNLCLWKNTGITISFK